MRPLWRLSIVAVAVLAGVSATVHVARQVPFRVSLVVAPHPARIAPSAPDASSGASPWGAVAHFVAEEGAPLLGSRAEGELSEWYSAAHAEGCWLALDDPPASDGLAPGRSERTAKLLVEQLAASAEAHSLSYGELMEGMRDTKEALKLAADEREALARDRPRPHRSGSSLA